MCNDRALANRTTGCEFEPQPSYTKKNGIRYTQLSAKLESDIKGGFYKWAECCVNDSCVQMGRINALRIEVGYPLVKNS